MQHKRSTREIGDEAQAKHERTERSENKHKEQRRTEKHKRTARAEEAQETAKNRGIRARATAPRAADNEATHGATVPTQRTERAEMKHGEQRERRLENGRRTEKHKKQREPR